MSTTEFCPGCCNEAARVEHVTEPTEFDLGGVKITVDVMYRRCLDCGEEFNIDRVDGTGDPDPLPAVYAEYERRTGKKWRGRDKIRCKDAGQGSY